MPDKTPTLAAARAKVDDAFKGFIANEEAVRTIKRTLTVALSQTPVGQAVSIPKTFLLTGPASTGKSDISRRITSVLDLPFVRLDGRAVRSRERLFDMIDEALANHNPPLKPETTDTTSGGMPVVQYPGFVVLIDEVHLVGERTQEAFLTLLEADDRTIVLDGDRGRRRAVVDRSLFVFATTKASELDRAFRSRCIEVQLRRYTVDEVEQMVKDRFPSLPPVAIERIAACARMLPRVAFDMAREFQEEVIFSDDETPDIRACIRSVMHGRGILFANGVTRDDLRYLETLRREGRAVGEGVLKAQLYDVDQQRISEDIEPFLMSQDLIRVTSKGRVITSEGERFLKEVDKVSKA